MYNLIKIKQSLSLDKSLFLKIKENICAEQIFAEQTNGFTSKSQRYWLFAESLGEFRLALTVMELVNNIVLSGDKGGEAGGNKNKPLFFVSLKTKSAYALAKKILNSSSVNCSTTFFFHPSGFLKIFSNHYVSAVKPDCFISVEHPVSNNLINALLKVNSRICFLDANPVNFKKIKLNQAGGSQSNSLRTIFFTVSDRNKKTIIEKTQPFAEKFNIAILEGSLKYNLNYNLNSVKTEAADAPAEKSGNTKTLVISFISVHRREAKFILEIAKEIAADRDLGKNCNIKFIFAPRNIKIASKLFNIASNFNLNPLYLNNIYNNDIKAGFVENGGFKSLLINDYGSLESIYPISDIVYVGKSLYEKESGGHNILEPAMFGKVVITGSYAVNFQGIVDNMLEYDAITVISEHNFKNTLYKLINNDKLRKNLGLNAFKFYYENVTKSKKALSDYLSGNIIAKI